MADQTAGTSPAETKKTKSFRPDWVTFGGVALALAGILGGLVLEGGRINDVAQVTAALIVLCGTFGAVMISTPGPVLKRALGRFATIWFEKQADRQKIVDDLIGYATRARKSGLVSLEQDAWEVENPFLRKALTLAVDGTDMQELRAMMELEMHVQENRAHAEGKVFETAGGYAPTIGIIGAVMGLIQVMKNLANIEEVGHGIAVAFVATVYGVGLANVVLLPAANKMRARLAEQIHQQEMILEGVISITEGMNPKLIRAKLEAYLESNQESKTYRGDSRLESARKKRGAAPADAPAVSES